MSMPIPERIRQEYQEAKYQKRLKEQRPWWKMFMWPKITDAEALAKG